MALTLNPRILFLALVLAIGGLFYSCSDGPLLPAYHAEAHDRGDFLPNLPTWAQQRIMQRGYAIYRMDARTATWPNVAATIARCMADEEANTTVHWVNATADPNADVDLIFYMPDSYPNDGSAGSAYYTNAPAFINVNFRTGYTVWDSTYCHEFGHINGEEDFYYHPLTCNSTAKWTVMSCGTGIGVLQALDRDLQRNVYMPDLPSVYWVYNDSRYLWLNWNGVRKSSLGCQPFAAVSFNYPATTKDNYCGHYNVYIDNATHVAIFYNDGDGWAFSGYYGNPAAGSGVEYRGFDRAWWCPSWSPQRHFGVRPESAIPGTWYGWPFSLSYISGDIADAGSC